MTTRQHEVVLRLRRMGYVTEFDRWENNGIVRINCVRKLRRGVFAILVRPDGTYRDSRYTRWSEYEGIAA